MKKTATTVLKLMLISAFFLVSPISNGQVPGVVKCYTDEMDAQMHADHPSAETKAEFEEWMQQAIEVAKQNKVIGGVYQIPVVFHVIHSGEAIGSGTNVSQAAIQSQIDVLNEDFRRMFGSNGYNTNPLGADTQIEFCLAQRRPDGSAFAAGQPGVNRILYTSITSTAPPYTTNFIDATIKTWTYNGGVATATRGWVPTKYMNIWLCNISGGILGYAQFPTSPLGGMSNCASGGSNATDGVVFLYNSIGKSSVTGFPGPYNEGRTATHEIGHWLGLRHIWGDGNCSVDDYCNDTPDAAAANFGCPTINSCTNAPDPGNDMVANYMDYTDDLCMNIFTNDQKQRMRAVLEGSPNRVSLINSDACIPPNTNDASITDVFSPKGDNCPGSLTPSVQLRNRGSATLTSATISYNIDGGAATNFSWTGSLAAGSSVTVSLPAFTALLGTHTFKSWNSLPNGAADPSATYDTSAISFVVSNGIMPNYTQDFEGQTFPPDLRWIVENVNADCFQWTVASGMSASGTFINNMAMLPFYGDASTTNENLYTPIYILPCNATAATLTFNVAYRQRTSTTNDRLIVEISQDCGATWTATSYDKQGSVLAVSSTLTGSTEYYPTAASHWRAETISLMSYVSTTSKNIRFRFRGIANNGNNIFVDDIKFNGTTPGEIQVMQSTTEVLDEGFYNFPNTNVGNTSTQTFTINNTGTTNLVITPPATVTGTGFALGTTFGTTTIPAGGSTTFTVTFTPPSVGAFTGNITFATNDCDEGTYNFTLNGNGIAVPTASFTATPNPACVGQTVTFTNTSTLATSYSWNFGTGATPATATTAGPHTVTYSSAGTKTVTLQINGTGPTSTQSVVVNANPSTPTITAGGPTTFCAGGSVTLTAPASTSYLWSTGETTQAITVTTSGSYTVQVFNASGCSATSAAKVVTVNPLPTAPTITAGGPTTFCTGGSVVLTSSSASGNTWSTGATTQSITVNSSGTYTVTLTSGGCTSAASAGTTVTVNSAPSAPTITAGGPTTFCSGGSVVLTSSSASGNTWSTGATTQSITVTTSGTYTATVTSGGCTSASSTGTTITVNPTPTIALGTVANPTTCSGTNGSIQVSGSGTGNISWSGTASGSMNGVSLPQTISGLGAGSYTISFVNTAGCSSNTLSQSLTAPSSPSAPTITAGGPTTFCSGGSLTLTSSTGSTYLWSTGETTSSITVSSGGSYTVQITNASGCTSPMSSPVVVTVNSAPATPVITAGSATTFCAGQSVTLTSSGSNNTWSTTETTNSIVVSASGTFTVTETNGNGCTATSAPITVTVNPIPATPVITASGPTTFCQESSVTLTSSSSTGNTWSTSETTPSISVATSGTVTLTVTTNGCTSAPASQSITVNTDPVVSMATLNGVCTYTPAFALSGGSPAGGTYSGNGVSGGNFNPSVAGLGTTTITYTFTDGNGCTGSATTTIVVDGCAGLNENIASISLYPNPTNGLLHIESTESIEYVTVYDKLGKLVFEQKALNNESADVDLSGVATGVYTIHVATSGGTTIENIVIQK